jgi:PilZ domain
VDKPRGAERRRAPRRQVAKPLALVVNSDRDKISSGAFAVDLSDLGARIRAKIHLEPGQLITVIPNEGPSQGIPSQVIWVSEAGGAHEAGIAFLQPLPARSEMTEAMAS